MKIGRLKIRIENGQIQPHSLLERFLEQWNGKEVFLSIEEQKSQRSLTQNSYYWLYLGIISDETGEPTERLHALFKGKFLTKGIHKVMGHATRVTYSTTELSKGEFSGYIANIEHFTEIPAPDTTEYFGYSYHK